MSQSARLPVRSFLTAGVSAAMVGTVALAPASVSEPAVAAPLHMIAPEIQLTTAGETIIVAYDSLEPWVAYGFELADYALSFVPGLWWIAPGIDLAYFTVEPVVQSLVYSFAFLIDGNFTLIGPTIQTGIQTAVTNFVDYGIAWIGSLVPLPPLPPLPPFPGAAVKSPTAARAVTARTAARAAAAAATAPADAVAVTEIETAADIAPMTLAPKSRRDAGAKGTRAAHPATPAAAATVAAADSPSAAAAPAKVSARKSQRAR